MSGPGHEDQPRGPAPPEETSGHASAGRPMHYVEFKTPVDPMSQPVGTFPALAPPPRPLRPPRRSRQALIVVSVPVSALLGLAVLAAIAGLVFLSAIVPWPAPLPPTPSGGDKPGIGVLGTRIPDPTAGSGIGAGPGGSASPDAGASPGTGASRGPSATASVTPLVDPTVTPSPAGGSAPPTTDVYISSFSATPVALVAGYQVTVSITNSGSESRSWDNVGIQVNGGVSLTMTVQEPADGVRVFRGSGRACLAPTTSDTATLDAGETLTIVFRISAVLSQAPGPAQTPDRDGCRAAQS